MKRILSLLVSLAALVSCNGASDVPFSKLDNYFFKNGQVIPDNPKIDTEEAFSSLFGLASFMGGDGKPTPIDFGKEFVIAVVNPVTGFQTDLEPESLHMEGGELVFTYNERVGESQTWSMQPILLIKVDRKYETKNIRLCRMLQVTPEE